MKSSIRIDDGLRLVLGNTIGAIEAGRLEMRHWLDPMALNAKVINRLEVVFEELVSNVVRHGFTAGADQTLVVTLSATPDLVTLCFEDDGRPFNPLAVPQPDRLTSLETAKLGGLGLPLVRKFAARLAYEDAARDMPREAPGGRLFQPCNRLTVALARSV